LGILEKQFIKITQAEKQEGLARQFAFDPAILRHHRRQLCVLAQAGAV
jgi:hypothetical protein